MQPFSSTARQRLHQITNSSNDILARVSTVFPITLFPDTVIVDRTQVTITHRTFIMTGGVISIRIEDILSVTAEVGLLFGSLKIVTRYFDTNVPHEVRQLWRDDALRLKALIHGLVVASKRGIDTATLGKTELVRTLTTLGQSTPSEAP